GAVRDAGEAREGPPAGGASVQRPRGTAGLVETVHTPTTGRARLSRTLPTACPQAANSRAFSLPGTGRENGALPPFPNPLRNGYQAPMRQSFDETTDPSFAASHLPLLRARMAEQGLDGWLVPHEDEH